MELTGKEIRKSYGKKEVLCGIDLTLEEHKIYGLIGRNGAGKTTLLSVLTAQSPLTSGSVTLDGQTVWENKKVLSHLCFAREISQMAGNGIAANGEADKQYPVGILRTRRKGGVQQSGIHDLCGAADRQPQYGGGKWHTGRQNGVCVHKFKFHLVGFLLSLGSFGQVMGAVDHDSPEALFALMLTLPAQVIVGHTPPVIEEEGQLQLPFLAHSRHGASYHGKSAHFSRNGRDGRIAVFGVMFRGDFQGKGGHRAALKSPIVSWTGQTTPRRFVMFG